MNTKSIEDTAGWPPEKTVFAVPAVELRVLGGDHPVHLDNVDAISANWAAEIAANPTLFDGRMVFQRRLEIDSAGIRGEAHVVPFSSFMWWRKQADRSGGFHLFGYPVIASSDGALVAIRMGAHTANAGQVYFAAGSLDEHDIVDGFCDIASNMRREVGEETGLDLDLATADGGYYGVHQNSTVTLFRIFRFSQTAEELVAAIERHMIDDEEQEIAGAVVIRSADPTAQPYHGSMVTILDWYFNRPA